jgi:hypothetical protein
VSVVSIASIVSLIQLEVTSLGVAMRLRRLVRMLKDWEARRVR